MADGSRSPPPERGRSSDHDDERDGINLGNADDGHADEHAHVGGGHAGAGDEGGEANPHLQGEAPLVPPADTPGIEAFKVFVGGLNWEIDDQALGEAFECCGTVTGAHVQMDHATGRNKGFGFVTFADMESRERAIQDLNKTVIRGREVSVNVAFEKGDAQRSQRPSYRSGDGGDGGRYQDSRYSDRNSQMLRRTMGGGVSKGSYHMPDRSRGSQQAGGRKHRINIRNLPAGCTWSSLKDYLRANVGQVQYTATNAGPDGETTGVADFDSEREMLSAISKINGMDFDGNRIRVTEVQASAHNDYDDRGGYDYGSQGRGSGAGAGGRYAGREEDYYGRGGGGERGREVYYEDQRDYDGGRDYYVRADTRGGGGGAPVVYDRAPPSRGVPRAAAAAYDDREYYDDRDLQPRYAAREQYQPDEMRGGRGGAVQYATRPQRGYPPAAAEDVRAGGGYAQRSGGGYVQRSGGVAPRVAQYRDEDYGRYEERPVAREPPAMRAVARGGDPYENLPAHAGRYDAGYSSRSYAQPRYEADDQLHYTESAPPAQGGYAARREAAPAGVRRTYQRRA